MRRKVQRGRGGRLGGDSQAILDFGFCSECNGEPLEGSDKERI